MSDEERTDDEEDVAEDEEPTEREETEATDEEEGEKSETKKQVTELEELPKTPVINVLKRNDAELGLKRIGRTADGMGFAYTEIDVSGQSLTNVDVITEFVHVVYVNVSNNLLNEESIGRLSTMERMLMLRADRNNLSSSELPVMPLLQILTLNSNNITQISGIEHPNLTVLHLNDNKIKLIENLNPDKLVNLRRLSLKRNLLKTASGINLPSLVHLYLNHNNIKKLNGLDSLVNLKVLNLAGNKIRKLKTISPNLRNLQVLNLRNNKIEDVAEFKRLKNIRSLDWLIAYKNAYDEFGAGSEIRVEILARVLQLKKLNRLEVSKAERISAINMQEELGEEDDEEEDEEDKDDGDEDTENKDIEGDQEENNKTEAEDE